jgi:hypothetical protein
VDAKSPANGRIIAPTQEATAHNSSCAGKQETAKPTGLTTPNISRTNAANSSRHPLINTTCAPM